MTNHNSPTSTAPSRSAIATLAYLLIGPLVWALHFTTLYGVQSIVCTLEPGGVELAPGLDAVRLALAGASVGALIALVVLPATLRPLVLRGDDVDADLRAMMRTLCGLSALAILAATIPVASLPSCPALR